MTKSQEIEARAAKYARVEKVADALGRIIGVRRLKPSQLVRVQEFGRGPDGMTSGALMVAAAVCSIDEAVILFPKSREELDGTLDSLDEEGMKAALDALGRFDVSEKDESGQVKSEAEAAKN